MWKSYRYGPTGDITFGKPQYNNSYAYNAEDYNPNLEVQYLRARYYDVERGNFLTEDTYLGKLTDPLTLNRYNYVKSSAPNYVDPSGHKKQSWTETADQAKKNWQEYNKMPVQDYDSGPDYGSKNKELLEELDKKLSTARTKLKKLMDAAEEKGRSVIGYCSDYKAGMDAGRKIAEAKYHNWELTLLFGKNAYKRDDYFWDTDLQEIYDQARNASNNKDAFSAGFTAGQTMFTIEILSLIVGALESGGSSSGGQQVVLPGVGEVTIPGDAAGSVAGVLPPGSILRDQENKKESEEEGKGDSNTQRNGVPVKEKTKASNGLDYQSNPKHTPGQPGNRPNAGIEPKNSLDLFGESVPSTSKPNQRFTYDAETSTLHRFYNDGNGTWHWSGSTNQGANSTITGSQVPNDIKNIFGLPKKGW
nr:RHS repeat-associated core domain-containing protein [[Clostridium] symbiosum]